MGTYAAVSSGQFRAGVQQQLHIGQRRRAVPLTITLDVQHAVKLIVHGGRSGSCRHQQLDRGGRGGVTRGGQWGMGWRGGMGSPADRST